MYEIKSYQGFGDIKFGDESISIEKTMKVKPSKFKKSPYDMHAGIKDAMEDNRQNAGPEIRSVYTYAEYGFLTSASVGFGKCILFSTGAHQLG